MKLLAIDDDRSFILIASHIAEKLGLHVDAAVSLVEALDMLRALQPDVLLIDYNLPDGVGLSVLEAVRALPAGERPYTIVATSDTSDSILNRAIEMGANDYWRKEKGLDGLETRLRIARQRMLQIQANEVTTRTLARRDLVLNAIADTLNAIRSDATSDGMFMPLLSLLMRDYHAASVFIASPETSGDTRPSFRYLASLGDQSSLPNQDQLALACGKARKLHHACEQALMGNQAGTLWVTPFGDPSVGSVAGIVLPPSPLRQPVLHELEPLLAAVHQAMMLHQQRVGRERAEELLQLEADTLRELHRIANSEDIDVDQRIHSILDLGCRAFGTSHALVTSLDAETIRVRYARGQHAISLTQVVAGRAGTPCDRVVASEEKLAIAEMLRSFVQGPLAFGPLNVNAYLGAPISIASDIPAQGTVCFLSESPMAAALVRDLSDLVLAFASTITRILQARSLAQRAQRHVTFLHQIIDGMQQRIAVIDCTGVVKAVDVPWQDSFDHYGGAALNEGDNLASLWDAAADSERPDTLHAITQLRECMSGARGSASFDLEYCSLSSPCHIRCDLFAISLDNERLIVVSATDITERVIAEAEVRRSEERFRQVVNSQQDMIVRMRPDGRITFVNRAMERAYCLASSRLLGHDIREFMQRDMALQFTQELLEADEPSAPVTLELPIALDDQDLHWERWVFTPIHNDDGVLIEFQGVGRDISELRSTKDALLRSESMLSSIVGSLEDGVFSLSTDLNEVFYLGPAIASIFGVPLEECYLRPRLLLECALPDDASKVTASLQELYNRRRVSLRLRIHNDAEHHRTIQVEARIVRDPSTRRERIDGLVRDITEREALQERLQQSQKLEAVGTLASGIAHDFNNLLTPILVNADLMEACGRLNEQDLVRVSRIGRAARRAREVVQSILQLGKRRPSNVFSVDVNRLVTEVVELARDLIPSHITLATSLSPDTPAIRGDGGQLHQALLNLVTNAYRALGTETGEITLRTKMSGDLSETGRGTLVVEVEDTGPGIPPELRQRVFDPFFTTSEEGRGSGLGLAMVYSIVNGHGGHAEIVDRQDMQRGTCVRITLPAEPGHVARSEVNAPSDTSDTAARGALNILVVDDEIEVADAILDVIESLGHRATHVADPRLAVQRLVDAGTQYDLVITDQSMPNLQGLDLAQQLLELLPQLPIVVLSGRAFELESSAANLPNVRRVLSKPVSVESLETLLASSGLFQPVQLAM